MRKKKKKNVHEVKREERNQEHIVKKLFHLSQVVEAIIQMLKNQKKKKL